MTMSYQDEPVLDLKPIVDNSVIEGEFAFSNCVDIHIGPKYENSNNIVINQNISVPSDVLDSNIKSAINEELQKTRQDKLILKDSLNRYSLIMKIILPLSLLVIMTIIVVQIYSKDIAGHKGFVVQNTDDYPLELQFVMRENWGAAQPLVKQKENPLPVRRVIFIHTVSSSCNKYTSCAETVRNIQELHMDEYHKFGDIGYNFILGGDGYIYVGVGWDKVGAHTAGFNTGSLGVAFIGDFRTDELNEKMTISAKELLQFAIKRKKLSEDYQLFGHCQMLSAFPFSPGKNIMKVIKDWDHWNDTNINMCK